MFVDKEIATNLIDKLVAKPEQIEQTIGEFIGKFNTANIKFDLQPLSVNQIRQLLDNGNETLIHWLATDKVLINWTAVIEDNHTLLTQLVHMQEDKYAQEAIDPFNKHQDWQVSHNIPEMGKVDAFFGDLI